MMPINSTPTGAGFSNKTLTANQQRNKHKVTSRRGRQHDRFISFRAAHTNAREIQVNDLELTQCANTRHSPPSFQLKERQASRLRAMRLRVRLMQARRTAHCHTKHLGLLCVSEDLETGSPQAARNYLM